MSRPENHQRTFSNLVSERAAFNFLLNEDSRFTLLSSRLKNAVLDHLNMRPQFTQRVFDLVWFPDPPAVVDHETIEPFLDEVVLIETKSTRKPIKDDSLSGFFFGATQSEYDAARLMGERYRFAFVVLNSDNVFSRPFYRLLTLDEVEELTRSKRLQYQVTLR